MNAPMFDPQWLSDFALETRRTAVVHTRVRNACILSSRLGMMVLDRLGVKAQPRAVYVTVFNPAGWQASQQRLPVEQWPPEAWSMGNSPTNPNGEWNGHLVLVLRHTTGRRLLVDLSADQFDRPERHIALGGPVCIGLDSTWTPHDPAHATVDQGGPDETLIFYRPIPPQDQVGRQWREAPDWTRDAPHLEEEAQRIADQVGAPEVADHD